MGACLLSLGQCATFPSQSCRYEHITPLGHWNCLFTPPPVEQIRNLAGSLKSELSRANEVLHYPLQEMTEGEPSDVHRFTGCNSKGHCCWSPTSSLMGLHSKVQEWEHTEKGCSHNSHYSRACPGGCVWENQGVRTLLLALSSSLILPT